MARAPLTLRSFSGARDDLIICRSSYCDLVEMMGERGGEAAHSTILCSVTRDVPEVEAGGGGGYLLGRGEMPAGIIKVGAAGSMRPETLLPSWLPLSLTS